FGLTVEMSHRVKRIFLCNWSEFRDPPRLHTPAIPRATFTTPSPSPPHSPSTGLRRRRPTRPSHLRLGHKAAQASPTLRVPLRVPSRSIRFLVPTLSTPALRAMASSKALAPRHSSPLPERRPL